MAKSPTKDPKAASDEMIAAMGRMMAFNPMGEAALKVWFDMGTEALRFMSARMQKDLETQKAMLSCKSLVELQKVQADFYSKAMEDYRSEMTRLAGILSAARGEELEEILPKTKRDYDDVPL
ncbi:MAG: phasin family protein [Sedimentitalea sp.]|nr:phasin family protein [Sedimentitalea sp.]